MFCSVTLPMQSMRKPKSVFVTTNNMKSTWSSELGHNQWNTTAFLRKCLLRERNLRLFGLFRYEKRFRDTEQKIVDNSLTNWWKCGVVGSFVGEGLTNDFFSLD